MKNTLTTFIFLFASTHFIVAQCFNLQTYTTASSYTFNVPPGGPYDIQITATGADGGLARQAAPTGTLIRDGGQGATMVASFQVNGGDQLDIYVGEAGGDATRILRAGGGGGGTAVILNQTHVLIAAAGGGGASTGAVGGGGQASTNSTAGGGAAVTSCGGGGFNAAGGSNMNCTGGGAGTLTGQGTGGTPTSNVGEVGDGGDGWGAGGGGAGLYGGAGGGYQGGTPNAASNLSPEGGDSFINTAVNNGMLVSNTAGADGGGNSMDGSVTISCTFAVPVELSYFQAKAQQESIALHWRTETETDNAGFEIQRSEHGKEFKPLSFIEGAGSTVEPQEYLFEDKTAHSGVEYFYRLKQIDFDGAFEYSEIVTAGLKGDQLEVSEIFPNPVREQAQINVTLPQDEQLTISIFDLTGKPLRVSNQQLDAGVNTLTIHTSDLPAGSYFVKLENATEKIYRKIIIK